ncbi:MAG: lipopolysaccharide export system protein LptA, partial [Rhodobacteraceae bacterium HLUCCA24]
MRAACLWALLAVPLAAQGTQTGFGAGDADPDAPVEVTAERLAVDQDTGTAVFAGDVLIVQGEMRLSGPEVRVVYGEAGDSIRRLEASGGVLLVSGEDAAEAQSADYDVETGRIVMSGEVLLTQGRATVASDRMEVDLESGRAELAGRVRTVLQPQGRG